MGLTEFIYFGHTHSFHVLYIYLVSDSEHFHFLYVHFVSEILKVKDRCKKALYEAASTISFSQYKYSTFTQSLPGRPNLG